MGSKKKRLRRLFGDSLPVQMRFREVYKILEDIGFICDNPGPTHRMYKKGDKRKILIAEKGRTVKREYLKRVKKNVEEAMIKEAI